MIASIKSEFRKLYSVRSTYGIIGISFALIVLFAFYIQGIKIDAAASHNPFYLASEITNAVETVALIGAIAGVLLMTHEYRYNTIMYTLTSSNSRTKSLLAKILVISVFGILFTLFFGAIAPFLAYAGAHFIKGVDFVHQEFAWSSIIWRCLFYGWGFSMLGLLLAALLRNQIAVLAALFIIPSTVEPLLSMLLKHNSVYLPFSSLFAVGTKASISYAHAAIVFGIYLVVGWVIAWALFLRRDAN